jgi:hypothetical protein
MAKLVFWNIVGIAPRPIEESSQVKNQEDNVYRLWMFL